MVVQMLALPNTVMKKWRKQWDERPAHLGIDVPKRACAAPSELVDRL